MDKVSALETSSKSCCARTSTGCLLAHYSEHAVEVIITGWHRCRCRPLRKNAGHCGRKGGNDVASAQQICLSGSKVNNPMMRSNVPQCCIVTPSNMSNEFSEAQ